MNQKQIDWTLIRKQIDDCLTDEERERLKRWVGDDEGRRHFVEHACQYYKRDSPVIDETRISEAWLHPKSKGETAKTYIFIMHVECGSCGYFGCWHLGVVIEFS